MGTENYMPRHICSDRYHTLLYATIRYDALQCCTIANYD